MTHNGCVRVDDEGWSLNSCQLDWFVLMYETYAEIANKVGESVKAVPQNCKIIDYVNSTTQKWLIGPSKIDESSGSSSSGSKRSSKRGSKKKSSTRKSSSRSHKRTTSKKKHHNTKKSSHHHHNRHNKRFVNK
jgi:hypothetical protein